MTGRGGTRPRLPHALRGLCLFGLTLVLGACAGPSASAAFAPYRAATLTAGVGLGDLRLNDTTLGAFTDRFPGGLPAALIGDDIGAEVTFPEIGVAFLFALEGDCRDAILPQARRLAADLRDPATFFARVPACRQAPLHSISVRAASTPDDTFFAGRTDRDLGLWAPLVELGQAEGPNEDVRGVWLAGEQPADNRLEAASYRRGITYAIGSAPAGDHAGHLVVRRIAVFRPAGPPRGH